MKTDPRELLALALPAALLGLVYAAAAGLLLATLEPAERAALLALVAPRFALVFLLWFGLSLAGGLALRWAWHHFGALPGRLAEQVQVLLHTEADVNLAGSGSEGSRALTAAVRELLDQRSALRQDIAAQVQAASREVEQERSRLAALMAELTQSVVVCNLDGRVLLFNSRARLQFRTLAPAIGGAELLGLGRSIYAVLDRHLVAHALESVHLRLQRGAEQPSAQFVTGTPGGQLLRVQLAPVKAAEADTDTDAPLNGFVLMLDNITRDFTEETQRDRLLHQYTEASRAALGNLQAAVELMDDPALNAAERERFQAVVRDEVGAMSRRISELASHTTQSVKTRWPLEDMRGSDLVAAALRRIEQLPGCRAVAGEVDAALWLKVDSYSLIQTLASLADRLVEGHGVKLLQLRLQPAGASQPRHAHLDLLWTGSALSTETVIGWETEPMQLAGESSPLSVRDVVQRHGGAFWFERIRVSHSAFFRFLLPLADSAAALDAAQVQRSESRPEFYDFDLFKATAQSSALASLPLTELAYTVFDTETTGLSPSDGDQILQIGATRINAGKLRRQDCFDQLVDPQRSIPAAGRAVHGITPERVAGQPTISVVLPAFHAFAADSVLVAHNAAFDLRFLQLLETSTGLSFTQPVLDTLLLSAVVHPQQESHSLEAIAGRLGVTVLGRHSALGDAMVTAEVFLKLLPLLQAMGIHTLGQALAAAQKTYYARLAY